MPGGAQQEVKAMTDQVLLAAQKSIEEIVDQLPRGGEITRERLNEIVLKEIERMQDYVGFEGADMDRYVPLIDAMLNDRMVDGEWLNLEPTGVTWGMTPI
jgi:hypothetical protein